MARDKPHFNLIFIGHVDHGKSTTVGRIMFDTGSVNEQAMRKLKEKAAELGKSGFEFAFVMDNLKEERERGVTIDLAHQKFETDKYYFTIIDAPGHRDFVKNMITGANQADGAVLMCAADDGVNAQTREHAFLSRTFGISQIIVAINKMDKVGYDEKRYHEVEAQMHDLLKKAGFKPEDIRVVPIASLTGDNVVKKTDKMPWWTGKTLVEMFDDFVISDKPIDLPLRLPIQDVYNIQGIGCVPVGRVETGVMKPGQKVIVVPGKTGKGVTGEVKSIEMHHEPLTRAEPGDNVGFNLRGIGKNDIARGDVLCDASSPASVIEEFEAQIVVINHPSVITVGYTPVLHAHTAQVACQFVDLGGKDMLKTGDVAKVKLRPTKPFVIESSADNKFLSRFAIRDMGSTVGAGVVTAVKKREL